MNADQPIPQMYHDAGLALLDRAVALNADVYHFELNNGDQYLGSVFVVTDEKKRDEIIALIGSLK